jgi:hypothetical protein
MFARTSLAESRGVGYDGAAMLLVAAQTCCRMSELGVHLLFRH